MSRTVIIGTISRLEFEYLIGTGSGIERRSEVHDLGLFTEQQMTAAFEGAGLAVERMPEALRTRGVYVGKAIPAGAAPHPATAPGGHEGTLTVPPSRC